MAVITALLLTTLAVTIVASLFWQQQVQVRSMENQRLHLQTKWILRGGLDLVRLVLEQDGLSNPKTTVETGIWATPLAETRLDDYVERERVDNEKYDATLSGQVTDAQARYNLANLAQEAGIVPGQVAVFQSLLQNLQLNPALAQAVAEEVLSSLPPKACTQPPCPQPQTKASREPLELVRVEDLLAVAGFTPQAVEKLREFVVVLPAGTKVNVNMASPEVLAALVGNYSLSEAKTLAQYRKRSPFDDPAAFTNYLGPGKSLRDGVDVVVHSDYFLVQSHVRLDRAALDAESLLYRGRNSSVSVQWMREN
ncbi:type II secretion system minor pseudopilin GspK [Pseudoduganella sp. LjRoot289]|uniref:type II secretion system minor pseudopilin GspK n=1 Tax=Pseudoduganella sp. LjRoot289 TaxID=3342314 RepID=UPI003ED12E40